MKEFASYSWEFNPLNNHPKIIKLKIMAFRICSICLNLNKLNIKPCQACIHCKTNEGVCATHDDMQMIYEEIPESEAFVLALISTNPSGPISLGSS